MKLIPTWPIAAVCLALGVAGGAVSTRLVYVAKIDKINADHAEELRVREVQRARDEVAARQEERRLTLRAGEIEQEKTNEIAAIRAAHAVQLSSLQNRPDRKPAPAGGVREAAPACSGSTGAELSRPDAEFLAREAARADELRAALSSCYAAYDSLGTSSR